MNSTNTQKKIKLLGFFLLLLSVNFSFAKLVPRGTTTKAKVVNATTITIAKPTGTLLGDVLVVNMVMYGSYDKINSEQTGWKLVDARPIGIRSYAAVFYKIAGTAEPTEYSFSVPNGSCTEISGTISGFWGNETIDKLFDVIPTVISVTKSGNVCKVPAITTKSDEVSLVFLAQAVGTSSSNSKFSTIKAAAISSNFTVVSDYNAGNTALETAMLIQNKAGDTGEFSANMTNAEIGEGGIVLAFKKFVVTYRTVGNTPFADYQTLGAAFNDINNGKLTGDVKLLIIANTNEISGAYLFGSGDFFGGAKLPTNYSSVTIYPTMPNLIISGNTTDFIINLYGADKVSIDGRVMGTTGKDKDGKDVNIPNLTIIQKNNTATTVIIANTAKNNTIKYCFLKGAGLDATTANIILKFDSIVYSPQPTTQIVNGVSTTTIPATEGNNDNTIDNCTFMGFADLVTNEIIPPTYAIYSNGVNTTSPNKNNTINECNFVDMLSPKFSSIVIDVEANSDGFKITKNKFSQTKELNYVSNGGKTQYVYVAVNQASNCVISENSINNNGKALKNSGASDITQVFPFLLNIGNNNKVEKNKIENLTLKLGNITNTSILFAGIYLLDQAGTTCSANDVKNIEIWSDLKNNSSFTVTGINAFNLTDYATTVPTKSTIIGNTIDGITIKGASANFLCSERSIFVRNSPGIEVSSNTVKNISNSGFSAADIQGVTGITIEAGKNKILQDPHVTTTTTNEQFPPSIVNGELVPGPTTTTIITTDQQVLWSSNNTAVAKVVMATGQVFALANGTATISALASDGNITDFLVTVTDPKGVVSADYLNSTIGSNNYGIYLSSCSNFIVNNNTIESLTNNDKGPGGIYGIAADNGIGTITNNSVKTLKSSADVTIAIKLSVAGIFCSPNNSGSLISKNTVENLTNNSTNTNALDQIAGIFCSADQSYMLTEISKNKISNLTNNSINIVSSLYGIRQGIGSINCNNNIIDIGENVSNNISLVGIYDEGFDTLGLSNANSVGSYINNTVRIKGSTTSNSTATTQCFYAFNRNYSSALTLKNNLFLNTRTSGAGNKNYAIVVTADAATKANQFNLNIAFDYNDYFVSNSPDNYIGNWVVFPSATNGDKKLFTDWKKVTDPNNLGQQDASSQSVNVEFDCANQPNVSLAGVITQIDTDFYDTNRNTYLMGAVEAIPNVLGLNASPGNSTTCKNTNTKDSFTLGAHPGYKVVKWEKSADINFSKDIPKIDYDALVKAGTISATDAALSKANQDFTYEQYTEINEIKSGKDLITGDEVGNIASIKDPITGVVSTPVYYVRAALHNLSGCNANDEYSSAVAIDTYLDPTPIGLLDSAIFCISAKVKELTAKLNVPPGSNFYNSNAEGNPDGGPLTNLEAALHSGKYFVAPVALGGCVGPKTAFYVVIEDGAAITVTTSQSFCTGDKVEKLIPKPNLDTKKGDIIRWWSNSIGGTPLLETTTLTSGVYYVSKGISCGDVRKKVDITVNSIPNAPVVANLTQTLNGNTTVADLVPPPSATIKWYATQDSSDALDATIALSTRTYYVVSVNASGCESTRVAVSVIAPLKQTLCTGATVADLIPAPSTTFEWYDVATGGAPLTATTPLITGTYYILSKDSVLSCGATTREAVSVVVGILPPTVFDQTICYGSTVADFVPPPSKNIKWYVTTTEGITGPMTYTGNLYGLSGYTKFFVSAIGDNGCESIKKEVIITMRPIIPAPILPNTNTAFTAFIKGNILNQGDSFSIPNTSTTGGQLIWETGISTFDPSIIGTSWGWVSQTQNGCKSNISSNGLNGTNDGITKYFYQVNQLAPKISFNLQGAQNYAIGSAISSIVPTNIGGTVDGSAIEVSTPFNSAYNLPAADFRVDSHNNIFVLNSDNILKITPDGAQTTFVSSDKFVNQNGFQSVSPTSGFMAVAIDKSDNLYVSDNRYNKIWKINPQGIVSTFADGTVSGSTGNLELASAISIDSNNNIYIQTYVNNQFSISKITPNGIIVPFAGGAPVNGSTVDGLGANASISSFNGIIDSNDNFVFLESYSGNLRKVSPDGMVTTLGKFGSGYDQLAAIDKQDNLYSIPERSSTIIKSTSNYYFDKPFLRNGEFYSVSPNMTYASGHNDGDGFNATFSQPISMKFDSTGEVAYVLEYEFWFSSTKIFRKISKKRYTISPTLPAGLVFDTQTGIISGTPTGNSPLTTYTITAANSGGSSNATVAFSTGTVTPAPTVTTPVTYTQGDTAIALTATGTSLKWYTVATGGAASTTAPTPSTTTVGTTSYWVTQTVNSIESARVSIDVTVTAPATVAVTGVSLLATASITAGSTSQLTATIAPANATNQAVTWTSSNTAVATVSATGLVTAVAAGTANITATSSADVTKTATCAVTVTAATVAVTGVAVSPTTTSIVVGGTSQLTATVSPANATNKNVNWSSSNTAVATVSSTGLVTAVAVGSATITVTSVADATKTATCAVTVTSGSGTTTVESRIIASSDDVEQSSTGFVLVNGANLQLVNDVGTGAGDQIIGLRFPSLNIPQGATISKAYIQFTCSMTDATATSLTIKGEASDNSVTFVNTTNNVSNRVKTATTVAWSNIPTWNTIDAATVNEQTPELKSIVQEVINRAGFTTTSAISFIISGTGVRTAYTYENTPAKAVLLHIEYTTASNSVAVTGVTLNASTASIVAGSTQQLTATIAPANATNQAVTWSSSNTTVATVSSTGLVTALAAGTATITVASSADGTKTATSTITVTAATVAVIGVSVSPTTASIVVGATSQLTATVAPANATNKNVTWTSSAPSIATVSSTGLVTAVAAGTATITVTTADGGMTATSSVTVTAATVAVTGVTVSPTTASIVVGATSQLTATVAPANATNKNVTWTSSAPSIATVSSTGLVTAVAAGSATITATSSADATKTAISTVTVAPVAPTVSNVSYVQGATATVLTATGTSLKWYTASTGGTGSTTAPVPSTTSVGTTSYWVSQTVNTIESARAQIDVTVTAATSTPTIVESRIIASSDDVEQSSSGSVLVNGWNLQLVNDSGSGYGDQTIGLRFPSLNIPKGATISKAYIQFTTSITDNVATSLTIKGEAVDNSVTFTNTTNNVSNRPQTTASVAWSNIVAWNTVDAATVNQQTPDLKSIVQEVVNRAGFGTTSAISFIITGTGVRTAYTYDNTPSKAALLHIEYTTSSNVAVTGVSVSPTTASIVAGSSQQLTATVSPANATNQNVTWTSSNTAVVTVSTSGLVTAVAAGTAIITATTADGGMTATSAVTVTVPTVVVTGVTLDVTTTSIVAGLTQQLTATVAPTNATNQNVTWSSSNTAVATVSSTGLVTAVAVGTTTITVTTQDGAKTTNCSITVAPVAPTVSNVSYVQGATATALTATGTNLKWYTASTGGTGSTTAPVPSTTTVGTTSYWVSQTVNTIESARTQIDVTVTSSSSCENALNFASGVNDYVSLPATLDDSIGTSDFTLEFWLNPANLTQDDPAILSNSDWNIWGNLGWVVSQQASNISFIISDSTNNYDATFACPPAGTWSHVAIVVKRGSNKIVVYVNGLLQTITDNGSLFDVTGSVSTSLGVKIAQDGTGNYWSSWDGKMDDLRIWKVARTQSEVANNQCNVVSSSDPNLVANYRFNDCSGATLTDSKGSYNGTLTGAPLPTWVASTTCSGSGAVIGVSFNYPIALVSPNSTIQLLAIVSPANATNKNVIWSSSNTAVATVNSSGVVTGVAIGTAIITATSVADSTKKATCTVTVSNNLIMNPSFETAPISNYWTSCCSTLTQTTGSSIKTGAKGCTVSNNGNYGTIQDVGPRVIPLGLGSYYVEAWVKTTSGTDNMRIEMEVSDGVTSEYYGSPVTSVGTSWTKLSGVLNLGFTGTPKNIYWWIYTQGTGSYYVDDCMLVKGTSAAAKFAQNTTALAVDEFKQENDDFIKLYPNPVTNELTIQMSDVHENETAQIYNISGSLIREFRILSNIQQVNVEDLPNEVYEIRFKESPGIVAKFIKK